MRMKLLNIFPQTVKEFANDETVNYSDYGMGILYWLDDEMKKEVQAFEEKHNCMVYHAIHSMTNIGEMLALLYVSSDVEEWEDDRNDLKEMVEDYKGIKFFNPFAYVINRSCPDCSEFGRIGIIPLNGGIKRIY